MSFLNDLLLRLGGVKREAPPERPLDLQEYFKSPEGVADLLKHFTTPEGAAELQRSYEREIEGKQPPLGEAVRGDARMYSSQLGGAPAIEAPQTPVRDALRMAWTTDAYLPMLLYRLRVQLALGRVPLAPHLLHRACMVLAQIDIGKNAVIHPGVYIPHGQVVIDGVVVIGTGTVLSPWVTLGRNGDALEGPTLGPHVFVGTGAKILGPVKVGAYARVQPNSVVLKDVPAHATVAGVPARVISSGE